jgi:hypothetical protein
VNLAGVLRTLLKALPGVLLVIIGWLIVAIPVAAKVAVEVLRWLQRFL